MDNVMIRAKEIERAMCFSADLIRLDMEIAGHSSVIFYIDGMIDKVAFEFGVMAKLKAMTSLTTPYEESMSDVISSSMPIYVVHEDEVISRLSSCEIVLLIDGSSDYYIFSLRSYTMRSPSEPPTSTVLKGPREGFVEDIKVNMTMVRRRLRSSHLVFEMLSVGEYSHTPIALCYVDGIAKGEVISSVKGKISAIDTDAIIDSSYIARYIEERKYSIFNQVGSVEKPDIFAAKLLEGRVGIIVDGSPMALTVPLIFLEQFQSSEDYISKSFKATFSRLVRLFAFMLAILLPAVYVALQEFQYQIFPLKVLASLINTIFGVPLPPTLEMIAVLLIFEMLNETTIRMPRHIGASLSIVGAIVLGEATVSAGLLSSPSILIVALSSIGMYSVPDEADATSILRMFFVIIGGTLGLYGILLAIAILVAYLVGIKNYGTSYMAPFAPLITPDLKDSFVKKNHLDMYTRPLSIPNKNRIRGHHVK